MTKTSNTTSRSKVALIAIFATALPTFTPLAARAHAPESFERAEAADLSRAAAARKEDDSNGQREPGAQHEQRASDSSASRAQKLKRLQTPASGDTPSGNTSDSGKGPVSSGEPVQEDVVTTGEASDKTGASSQAISVPKGAGTLEGMGESFSSQLSTGIATLSVPIALPKARGAAQPSLALSYSSASGWGIAGLGWDIGVPFISRQTDRGPPRYDDRTDFHADQDRFVFNEGQELVPICTVQGTAPNLTCTGALAGEVMPPWSLGSQYFRPRVEGSFQRFFWSPDHLTWRVQDKSGVTLELGVPLDGSGNRDSVEANPADNRQIFRWNLARQYDTQGGANPTSAGGLPAPNNVVVYRYLKSGNASYVSDIYDTPPTAQPTTTDLARFAHHAHIEYEQRSDPTTSYRSGWLVERRLRVARVDVTSKTFNASDAQARRLLRRYYLTYRPGQHTSLLESVQSEGRCGVGEDLTSSAPSESVAGLLPTTSCPRLPPMTFEYTHVTPYTTSGGVGAADLAGYEGFDERIQRFDASPPHSVDEELADLFDLNSDALPDLMVSAPGLYGAGFGKFLNGATGLANTFSAAGNLPIVGVLGATANSIKLSNPNLTPLDFDGDGNVDLVHAPAAKTYSVYSLLGGAWVGRVVDTSSRQNLKIDFGRDALTTRVVDVNADGLVDVVVTTGTQIQTFFSLGRYAGGKDQLGSAVRSGPKSSDISNDPVTACLPWAGRGVDFGDPEIRLGELNGDGLPDIVRLQRGQIRYWPGRGDGRWGTGSPADCNGDFVANVDVEMQDSPEFSDLSGASLRLDDVNGDGLDDLLQIRTNEVDVWLNVDGMGFTSRHVIEATPEAPAFVNRVRLVDINGSGTRDILWGTADNYRYVDLEGGRRAGLLTRVKNGLGKSTDILYSTSTEEMLAAERNGGACTGPAWSSPWCSRMPIVAQIVKRVTESDNLSFAGSGPNQLVTEYSYRDPVYDGRQREFRGFRRARARQLGDANSPTSISDSQFLLGECVSEAGTNNDCSDLSTDNPREALKGLPAVAERLNEAGVYLSTDLSSYRLRRLYLGRDGREVRHAFESFHRTINYDQFGWVAGPSSITLPVLETELTRDAAFDPVATPLGLPAGLVSESGTIAVPATAGTASIDRRSQVDYFGNKVVAIELGCTSGSACPAAGTTGIDDNETLFSFTLPVRPNGDETSWLFRPGTSYVQGSLGNHSTARKKSTITYNAKGSPIQVQAELAGTVALDRRHRTLTGANVVAPAPSGRSVDGLVTVATFQYDIFGNQTRATGPNGRCRDFSYEDSLVSGGTNVGYAQLVTSETVYTQGCDVAGLLTSATYDRGLARPTIAIDPTSQATSLRYDEFGRLSALVRPRPSAVTPQDSLNVIYSLATETRPYSTIETRTQDSANVDTAGSMWSVSFIDGMGRTRLVRSEADPAAGRDAASAIQGEHVAFDAKGAVAKKYSPCFVTATAADGPPSAPCALFARVQYDAFGRVWKTFDVASDQNGVQTLRNDYRALSVDASDAADAGFDAAGEHSGTPVTTRKDGHGRVIAVAERAVEAGTLETREVRTKYLPSGEPEVITRVRVGAADAPVVRWMRYDTMGRLVLNVDPHTTANFTANTLVDATPATNGLRAWRYAYNDAGDLVGTSDARGCGVNYTYDGSGRVTSEDFSPCEAAHLPYSAPDASLLTGIEVFYQYDAVPAAFATGTNGSPSGYAASSSFLKGRLAAVYDRSSIKYVTYDGRGRVTRVDRRLSNPDPTVVSPSTRYRGRWYATTNSYDALDRVVRKSTGASSAELLDGTGKSEVLIDYSGRGTLRHVYGSYGELISSVKRSAEGLIEEVVYGDAATTTQAQTFNARRWLEHTQVTRATPSLWSSPPGTYLPAPNLSPSTPSTFQLILKDETYTYDIVGNPKSITDFRAAAEWPAGAKPVSRNLQYDDLYRVKQVDYVYPGGSDTFTSPFASEQSGVSDPRQSGNFSRQLVLAQRIKQQTFTYDWLGSLTNADDDLHAMWDRGVGPIGNFASTGMPYRFKNAGDSALSTWAGAGAADALAYDESGNLLDLQIARTGTCTGGGTDCSLRYVYAYDELGRLNAAERREGSTTKALLAFTYDHGDNRVIKTDNTLTPKYYTVYPFDSLELRRTSFDNTTGEYSATSVNETAFLTANGIRVGRVTYEGAADGEPRLANDRRHVLLEVGDQLGSTTIIVDKATGELAERLTYQAYGNTESDYRPARWKGFREDYRFTGKEEDIEVGLTYFGKRFLSAPLGRWVSPDPQAVHRPGEADLNLYAYVKGRVLAAIDRLGLDDDGGVTRFAIRSLIRIAPGREPGTHDAATVQGAREVLSTALAYVQDVHLVSLREAQKYSLETGRSAQAGAWVPADSKTSLRTFRIRFDAYENLTFGDRGGTSGAEKIVMQMLGHEMYHAYQTQVIWPSAEGRAAKDRGVAHYEGFGFSKDEAQTIYGEAMADAFGDRVSAYAVALRQLKEERASENGLTKAELDKIAGEFEERTSRVAYGYRYVGNLQKPVTDAMSDEMMKTVVEDSGVRDRFSANPELRSYGKPSWETAKTGKK